MRVPDGVELRWAQPPERSGGSHAGADGVELRWAQPPERNGGSHAVAGT
jgi:hypothetical protein